MRTPTALIVSVLLVFACSRGEDAPGAAAPADPAAEGAASETPQAAGDGSRSYLCSGGLAFNARIENGNALITMEGKTLTLEPVEGAVGAHYAGEGIAFVSQGDDALLARAGGAPLRCKAE